MDLEITHWLAGSRDYQAGVAIYNRYGSSDTLKRMFAGSDNSFCRAKLAKALQDLVARPAPSKDAQDPAGTPPAAAAPSRPAHQVPADFAAMAREKMRPLLDRRTLLHNRLGMHDELSLPREEIRQICAEIKKLTSQITPLYLQLQQGPSAAAAPPPPADFSQLTGAQLVKERSNLRSLRSKVSKKPERLHELPAIEARIEQLTQLINNQ